MWGIYYSLNSHAILDCHARSRGWTGITLDWVALESIQWRVEEAGSPRSTLRHAQPTIVSNSGGGFFLRWMVASSDPGTDPQFANNK